MNKVPVPQISKILSNRRGLWAAMPQGAFMRQADGSFRYYASLRWLDQDEVKDIAADSKGNVYLLTSTGLNNITHYLYCSMKFLTAILKSNVSSNIGECAVCSKMTINLSTSGVPILS